ncbi:MAG: hypothetical protein JWR19_1441 [Pedosphaera sp.]|nr:hypothetical protein [Pedosphaera sp.]
MNLNFHIKVVGSLMLALAFAHLYFPRRFAWREELAKLSLLNRQIFLVHCFFIVLVLVLCGLLSLFYTAPLLQPSPLARAVLCGLVIFWAARLCIQFFIYDSKLWRGHQFNTVMHILFSLLWAYYTAVYTVALWHQYH